MQDPALLGYFDLHFIHDVLVKKRNAPLELIFVYREAVIWWDRLMDDVPIAAVGQAEIFAFWHSLCSEVGAERAAKFYLPLRLVVAAAQVHLEASKA